MMKLCPKHPSILILHSLDHDLNVECHKHQKLQERDLSQRHNKENKS
jgi:hypothetical protein